jgi:ABC-type sugar transport system substrate-binding protein
MKPTTLGLALAGALVLAGCNPSDPAALAPPGGRRTIGVAFETPQTEYWVAGFEAIRADLKKRGHMMLDAVADQDATRQLEQVKNFITRKVDGIILVPKDGKSCLPMIKAANAANDQSWQRWRDVASGRRGGGPAGCGGSQQAPGKKMGCARKR